MNKRIQWYDLFRFSAALWIFFTHFTAQYLADLLAYWEKLPISFLTYGITGKYAVSILAVILGYFAACSGDKGKKLSDYVIKRFVFFVVAGFIANITNYGLGFSSVSGGILRIIESSFLLKDDIYPTFWCMRDFLLGSIICFINAKEKADFKYLQIECHMLIAAGQVWLFNCFLGYAIFVVAQRQEIVFLLKKKTIQIVLFVITFLIIKGNECLELYYIDGFASMMILLLIQNNCKIQGKLDAINNRINKVSKNYMEIFLLHPPFYSFITNYSVKLLWTKSYTLKVIVAFIASMAVIFAVSIPLHWVLQNTTILISDCFINFKENIKKRYAL